MASEFSLQLNQKLSKMFASVGTLYNLKYGTAQKQHCEWSKCTCSFLARLLLTLAIHNVEL